MNRRQRTILIKFTIVIVITAIMVIAMINFKDLVNRSEAMRAMSDLGRKILGYRNEKGSLPPESWVERERVNVEGNVRLGQLHYRARWIEFESTEDEILTYTERTHRSLFTGSGFIVLRLDGRVGWMDKEEFEKLLDKQQSPMEAKMRVK